MPYHTSNNKQNTSPANMSGTPASQAEELEAVRDVLTSYDIDNTTDVIIDSISTEQIESLENNFDVW